MMYPTNPTGHFNIPEPSLYPLEPVITGYCAKCKGELYRGEPTVFGNGMRMCLGCFRNLVESLLRDRPDIVAYHLGMKYEEDSGDGNQTVF